MRAEMNAQGVITLSPETSVEAYALSKWVAHAAVMVSDIQRAEGMYWRGSMLFVQGSVPETKGGV